MNACEPLCHFPFAAPARDNLAPGLRVGFSGSYAIYYMHDEHDLTLVRVLHKCAGRRSVGRTWRLRHGDEIAVNKSLLPPLHSMSVAEGKTRHHRHIARILSARSTRGPSARAGSASRCGPGQAT